MNILNLKSDNVWVRIARRYPMYESDESDICRLARRVLLSLSLTVLATIGLCGGVFVILTELPPDMVSFHASLIIKFMVLLGSIVDIAIVIITIGYVLNFLAPHISKVIKYMKLCKEYDPPLGEKSLGYRISSTWMWDETSIESTCERNVRVLVSLFFTILVTHIIMGTVLGIIVISIGHDIVPFLPEYIIYTIALGIVITVCIVLMVGTSIASMISYAIGEFIYKKTLGKVISNKSDDSTATLVKNYYKSHKNKYCSYINIEEE